MPDDPGLDEQYRLGGFGNRIGFGASPAVLTVDMFRAFTDPASPLALPVDDVAKNLATLLDAARAAGVPVIHAVVRYASPAEAPALIRKNPVLGTLTADNPFLDLDPRLGPAPGDVVLVKTGASAFFNTALQPMLTGLGVDTLVVTGIATSGCVRATVVDAIQHGLRPIVPAECVGDRFLTAHRVSLTEIDAKYADVEPTDRVLALLDATKGDRA
ncbi:isochorismatase family protein [Pseudonocardia hispaniensis]|uniref:Isochorismatase family protein n=1 Tax=Pseudonocardia hispaniensis TaxID=904933 RepID=A0ABW1J4K2_9PSEU